MYLDEILQTAKEHSLEYSIPYISPSAGAILSMLVATTRSRAVVEIGTGTGSSGLWVLRSLPDGGMLTTIDYDSHCQNVARKLFEKAGIKSNMVRFINERALNILPRLAKHAYDIVIIDGQIDEVSYYYMYAKQMVRPYGLIVILHSLYKGNVADPAMRDRNTVTMREFLKSVSNDDEVSYCLIGNDDGMTVCTKMP